MGILYDNYGIIGDSIWYILWCLSNCNFHQPFKNEFPCANIHELIAPGLLHQIIKGMFKDHLVTWVEELLLHIHHNNKAKVNQILDDIDRRWVVFWVLSYSISTYSSIPSIAISPPFAGLRHFPEGRGFKQWTVDDLKALMKVSSASSVLNL